MVVHLITEAVSKSVWLREPENAVTVHMAPSIQMD